MKSYEYFFFFFFSNGEKLIATMTAGTTRSRRIIGGSKATSRARIGYKYTKLVRSIYAHEKVFATLYILSVSSRDRSVAMIARWKTSRLICRFLSVSRVSAGNEIRALKARARLPAYWNRRAIGPADGRIHFKSRTAITRRLLWE